MTTVTKTDNGDYLVRGSKRGLLVMYVTGAEDNNTYNICDLSTGIVLESGSGVNAAISRASILAEIESDKA